MNLLLSFLILAAAVLITALALPGVRLRSPWAAVPVAAIYGGLNFVFGWLLDGVLLMLTFPLSVLVPFLVYWFVNSVLLKVTDLVSDRLKIDGFRWALGGAAMMSVLGTGGQYLLGVG